MLSTGGMIAMLVAYLGISVAAAFEHNWWRCLYYVGATVITIAVMGMTRRVPDA